MSLDAIKRCFNRVDKLLDIGFTTLIIFGGALIPLTVLIQVLLRYVFKQPLFGLEELSRLVAIWVYFFGAVLSTRMDNHVQGDVVEQFFSSPRAKSVIKSFVWCLCLLTCCLFVYHSWAYSFWLFKTGERTTGLWWPRITSVGSMFVGAVFMTLYSLVNLANYLKRALSTDDKDGRA
ncbi:MAG: TRAP transporter small permease [Desulfobacteraceae bacterium]